MRAAEQGRGPVRRRPVLVWLAALCVVCASLWGALLLWFQGPGTDGLRIALAAAWCLLGLGAAVCLAGRGPRLPALAWLLCLLALVGGWSTLRPSHERDWADDVAQLLQAEIDGNRLTLRNVRNFDWHSEDDYTVRWETREYDLDRLADADLVLSYWMGPHIAHTLVSFGFDDGRRLVFSLEIRKERGEAFSALGGFFREFESVLIAADENDIVRTRSNARGEDVYLYRVALPPEAARSLFLAYLDQAAALASRPRFYDTLTANCTTIVFEMAQRIVGGLPMDWRLLASGYLPEYLARIDGLAAKQDLASLRAAGRITERAKRADDDPRFAERIRAGVPGMPALTASR